MFKNVTPVPPDAIFGLTEAFKKDPNPAKINLGAGVYKDEDGKTPVLEVVKEAERRLLESESSKSYLPIDGSAEYAADVRRLLFGDGHTILRDGRAVTVHTPGGTGALRVAGELLASLDPETTMWWSEPTWVNHPHVFKTVGLPFKTYPYFDAATNALDFAGMIERLAELRRGEVVLLHGCCHNPTGVDPSAEQWSAIGDLLAKKGALPLVDFAYQGFAEGITEDATGVRILCEKVPELMVATSFSKNFGLYNERVGALTLVAPTADAAQAVLSRIKRTVRANYSNPPAHGSAIVAAVLADDGLTKAWVEELATMRGRIHKMRRLLADGLYRRGVRLSDAGNDFIAAQNGMFSFSGLGPDEVAALRERFSIYIVGSGRINVAGITEKNLDRLCDSIAAVMS